MKGEYETFISLRKNALELGLAELAITYGWTAMRLGSERIEQYIVRQHPCPLICTSRPS
jgi:hypothetical protein